MLFEYSPLLSLLWCNVTFNSSSTTFYIGVDMVTTHGQFCLCLQNYIYFSCLGDYLQWTNIQSFGIESVILSKLLIYPYSKSGSIQHWPFLLFPFLFILSQNQLIKTYKTKEPKLQGTTTRIGMKLSYIQCNRK